MLLLKSFKGHNYLIKSKVFVEPQNFLCALTFDELHKLNRPTSPHLLGSCRVPCLGKHLPSQFKAFIHTIILWRTFIHGLLKVHSLSSFRNWLKCCIIRKLFCQYRPYHFLLQTLYKRECEEYISQVLMKICVLFLFVLFLSSVTPTECKLHKVRG